MNPINYPPAGGPYIRNSHCAMFKLPVQTRIKKMKIPIRLNYHDFVILKQNVTILRIKTLRHYDK